MQHDTKQRRLDVDLVDSARSRFALACLSVATGLLAVIGYQHRPRPTSLLDHSGTAALAMASLSTGMIALASYFSPSRGSPPVSPSVVKSACPYSIAEQLPDPSAEDSREDHESYVARVRSASMSHFQEQDSLNGSPTVDR